MCIYVRVCVCDRVVYVCVHVHMRMCMGVMVLDGVCVHFANVCVCACIVSICDTLVFP